MTRNERICYELKLSSVEASWATSIKILDFQDETIGFLLPVGPWILDDLQTVESIKNWRQKAMKNFLVQFESGYERTWNYLQNSSILDRSRIFFIIASADRNLIGHIGLSNVTNESVELDNLIRGVSGGAKDLIMHAESALINWAFSTLQVKEVCLRVLSFNFLAINIHELIGFRIIEKIPLRMENKNGDKILSPCEPEQANVGYSSNLMRINQREFYG